MSLFLDIDRARSVFRLLFVCTFDAASTDSVDRQFQEDLREITQGVQIPKDGLVKLRSLYNELRLHPESVSSLAQQVARDFAQQREILLSVISIVLRISSDEGMLCAIDRERIRELVRHFALRAEELEHFSAIERSTIACCLHGKDVYVMPEELNMHLETLGCTPEMTGDEIRRRYRELAMQYHPDRSIARGEDPQAGEKERMQFQRIQEAYEALRQSWME